MPHLFELFSVVKTGQVVEWNHISFDFNLSESASASAWS